MAKAPSLTDLTSQYSAQSTVNNNNAKIEDAFENTLSRDGSSPNQMEADLDMNSNNLLNVGTTNTALLRVGGEIFLPSSVTSFINWEGTWSTSTSYQVYDLVFQNGSSYLCLEDHTSNNFATDLTAGKWALLAQKGETGTGSGDLVATNNLSDVDNASTSLSNLGGQPFSAILTTLADDKTLPTYTVTDFDTALESGFIYAGAGALNAPSDLSASAINGFVSRQGDNDLVQVVFGQSITRMYWRLRNAGTWSSWERTMRFSDVLDEDDLGGATPDEDMPPSQQSVKAYVDGRTTPYIRAAGNFNGSTIAERFSENLSIARTATGEFTFTMASPMPDANYIPVISSNAIGGAPAIVASITDASEFDVSFRRADTNAPGNPTQIFVQVFR